MHSNYLLGLAALFNYVSAGTTQSNFSSKNQVFAQHYKEKNFFRKGEVGSWQGVLTEDQINRVIESNRAGMERLGYVDANGKLSMNLTNK